MKIVFFGTPELVLPSLEMLHQHPQIDVIALVTQEDKPVGRKHTITPPPAKEFAKKHKIPVLQPKNKKELAKMLKKYKADFFVVIAYGMVIPKEVLEMPRTSCINVHFSLLPKYRGASPMQEAILNGDTETGISIIEMSEGLDAGGIYLIKRFPIDPNDTTETLSQKLSELTAKILPLTLVDIIQEGLYSLPQSGKPTLCRKISREDGKLDFNKTAKELHDMIRAYTPWPSTFMKIKGKKLKILAATTSDEKLKPGEFKIEEKSLKIGTRKGALIPQIVQLEGKKEMDTATFVNGYQSLL